MLGLYDYDNATYEECIADLAETIEKMNDAIYSDSYDEELDVLERRATRIQNIVKRLKEIEKRLKELGGS